MLARSMGAYAARRYCPGLWSTPTRRQQFLYHDVDGQAADYHGRTECGQVTSLLHEEKVFDIANGKIPCRDHRRFLIY